MLSIFDNYITKRTLKETKEEVERWNIFVIIVFKKQRVIQLRHWKSQG